MRISRTFLALLFTALILFAAAFYSGKIAQQIRNDEEVTRQEEVRKLSETTKEVQFWVSETGEDNRNFADYTAVGLFILSISTILAAIWIKKFDD